MLMIARVRTEITVLPAFFVLLTQGNEMRQGVPASESVSSGFKDYSTTNCCWAWMICPSLVTPCTVAV